MNGVDVIAELAIMPCMNNATTNNANVKLVLNVPVNVSEFLPTLLASVDAGSLPEELADVFVLTILKGFNADGSDRGVLTMA